LTLSFFHFGLFFIAAVLLFFFTAFTLMESILPSCVSKVAPLKNRGSAMGVYSTFQFLGIFFGGLLGGWSLKFFQIQGVFLTCTGLAMIWLIISLTLSRFTNWSTQIFSIHLSASLNKPEITRVLLNTEGVGEVVWQSQSGRLYLKIDKTKTNEDTLRKLIGEGNLSLDSTRS
jgi:MFS family permease